MLIYYEFALIKYAIFLAWHLYRKGSCAQEYCCHKYFYRERVFALRFLLIT